VDTSHVPRYTTQRLYVVSLNSNIIISAGNVRVPNTVEDTIMHHRSCHHHYIFIRTSNGLFAFVANSARARLHYQIGCDCPPASSTHSISPASALLCQRNDIENNRAVLYYK